MNELLPDFSFQDMPDQYYSLLNQIQNETIKKIFTYFDFFYIDLSNPDIINSNTEECIPNEYNINLFFEKYLNYFKFITYYITNTSPRFPHSIESNTKSTGSKFNPISAKVNFIICIEQGCFIFEQIALSAVYSNLRRLKENDISILNFSISFHNEAPTKSENEANEEIKNFCSISANSKEIKNNQFVRYLIRPILGYLIRRYFYPTQYFYNKSFFVFDQPTIANFESQIKEQFLFLPTEFINFQPKQEKIYDSNNNQYKIFNENDFIKLRSIYINSQANFDLVIHCDSLYIFMLKNFINKKTIPFEIQREIEFCKQYSNRCITQFYGFVKKDEKIVGIAYEYMSNGSLDSYMNSNPNKFDKLYSLLVLARIFQGIFYLHSNSLIHRDIKPSNILINHDDIPYISDFPSIRHPIDEKAEPDEQYTGDLGTPLYMSPEQFRNDQISYSTDIYSFGLIIYFIFEKTDLRSNYSNFTSDETILINGVSSNVQKLFQKCIKFNPKERIELDGIQIKIMDEIFDLVKNDLRCPGKLINYDKNKIIDLLYESDILSKIDTNEVVHRNNPEILFRYGFAYYKGKGFERDINLSIKYLSQASNLNHLKSQYYLGLIYYEDNSNFHDINKAIHYFSLAANQDDHLSQYYLGVIYSERKSDHYDINKSIHYLLLSANNNYTKSQFYLGKMYYEGDHITRDINKSILYFTLAANQNHPESLYYLGVIYYNNKYVKCNIKKSLHFFNLSSNLNYSYAQYELGLIYYRGKYVERDIDKSIHYFNLSANQNNSKAQYYLGLIYYNGKYIQQDVNKSIQYFLKSANQKNASSQYYLGLIYFEGKYVSQDIKKSIYYYTLAANQNHILSQANIGLLYYKGKYVSRDIKKSIHYLTLAANQNQADSQSILGAIYLAGIDIQRDINKAIHYLTLSANKNNPVAQMFLGHIYYQGRFVTRDINKAIHYFTLSANQKNREAQYILGSIYYGCEYVSRDINKAVYYFTLSAEQNHPESQNYLGHIYYDRKYGLHDINKSIHYLQLAANQNNLDSQYFLGIIYYEDLYITPDIYKSIHYFQLAANQNCDLAQFYLGLIYYEGNHITRDIKKSIHYFTLAADQNYLKAQLFLGFIYYGDIDVPCDIHKSIHFFTLAANKNSSYAQFFLGCIYYEGIYISANINKSIYYFTLAANQCHPEAQCYLGYIYLIEKSIQDIQKGIKYIQYSAENENRNAQQILADLIFEGKYLKRDMTKVVHLYKETSCFNNQFSKNNLGVIYRNGTDTLDKNISMAKEYFNEAIQQKNDKLSMMNLCNILLKEFPDISSQDYDKLIRLLFQLKSEEIYPAKLWLGFIIVSKHSMIDKEIIQNEYAGIVECSDDFINEIILIWKGIKLLYPDNKSFLAQFNELINIDYVYILFSVNIYKKIMNNGAKKVSKLKDINELFYEGLGYDLK